LPTKWFFAAPPILWMMALYFCLKVLKTEGMEVRLKAPNEIRDRLR
jgi:aspartate aminotransferase-like enzyme